MGNLVVIPARLDSTRLPRKALLNESGEALVLYAVRQAVQSQKADQVIVATDSGEIEQVVRKAGFNAKLTRKDHASGTDRVAEICALSDARRVVNAQGDEPFMSAELIDQLFVCLENQPEVPMVTAVHQETSWENVSSESTAKVVVNSRGEALYFSRQPIPHQIHGESKEYLRHIGIYGFQRDYLLQYTRLPPSRLERLEKLEQLRALENGDMIKVLETTYEGFSVDTSEEYQQFLKRIS